MPVNAIARYSIDDLIEMTAKYLDDNSEEIADTILYFVSDVTGLSVDRVMELVDKEREKNGLYQIRIPF